MPYKGSDSPVMDQSITSFNINEFNLDKETQDIYNTLKTKTPTTSKQDVTQPAKVKLPSETAPKKWYDYFNFQLKGQQFIGQPVPGEKTYQEKLDNLVTAGQVSYKIADLNMMRGKLAYREAYGLNTPEQTALLKDKEDEIKNLLITTQKDPYIAKAVGQVLPFIKESAIQGGKGAIIGALVGGGVSMLGGQVPPFTTAPEEVITAPVLAGLGAKIGAAFSSLNNIREIETGSTYRDLIQSGVDPGISLVAAEGYGAISTALEAGALKLLVKMLPGSKEIVKGTVNNAIKKTIMERLSKDVPKIALGEAGIETTQQLIDNIIQESTKILNDRLEYTDLSEHEKQGYINTFTKGLADTFGQTLVGFGAVAIPGVSIKQMVNSNLIGDTSTEEWSEGTSIIKESKSKKQKKPKTPLKEQEDIEIETTDVVKEKKKPTKVKVISNIYDESGNQEDTNIEINITKNDVTPDTWNDIINRHVTDQDMAKVVGKQMEAGAERIKIQPKDLQQPAIMLYDGTIIKGNKVSRWNLSEKSTAAEDIPKSWSNARETARKNGFNVENSQEGFIAKSKFVNRKLAGTKLDIYNKVQTIKTQISNAIDYYDQNPEASIEEAQKELNIPKRIIRQAKQNFIDIQTLNGRLSELKDSIEKSKLESLRKPTQQDRHAVLKIKNKYPYQKAKKSSPIKKVVNKIYNTNLGKQIDKEDLFAIAQKALWEYIRKTDPQKIDNYINKNKFAEFEGGAFKAMEFALLNYTKESIGSGIGMNRSQVVRALNKGELLTPLQLDEALVTEVPLEEGLETGKKKSIKDTMIMEDTTTEEERLPGPVKQISVEQYLVEKEKESKRAEFELAKRIGIAKAKGTQITQSLKEDVAQQERVKQLKVKEQVSKQTTTPKPTDINKVVTNFNKSYPKHDLKYDGEYDRSVINKPPIYSFTPQSGPLKGRTFSTESVSVSAINKALNSLAPTKDKREKVLGPGVEADKERRSAQSQKDRFVRSQSTGRRTGETTPTLKTILKSEKGESPEITSITRVLHKALTGIIDTSKSGAKTVAKTFDVEWYWKSINAPKTGRAMKNIFSRQDAEERLALRKIDGFIQEVRRGFGTKKIDQNDLANIVRVTELPQSINKFDPEYQEKLKPAVNWMTKFFDDAQQALKARGINVDYKMRMLSELDVDIKETADWDKRAKLLRLRQDVSNMQFVHIPIQMWFDTTLKKAKQNLFANDVGYKKAKAQIKLLVSKERRRSLINRMLDKGIIKPSEVNPVSIIMNYSRRLGHDYAIADIRDAAIKEKLIKIGKAKPTKGLWSKVPKRLAALRIDVPKGKELYISDDVLGYIDEALGAQNSHNWFTKIMAIIKMTQFYNPFILPMYDTIQSVMATLHHIHKYPKALRKTIVDVKYKTNDYYDFLRAGLASKPFSMPFKEWIRITDLKTKQTQGANIYQAWASAYINELKKTPIKTLLKTPYIASWQMAWTLDEYVRLFTANVLKDAGMSIDDAAQTAAMFHGDYACYDESTEVLTRRGWRKIKDLYNGSKFKSEVLTLNPVNEHIEFQHIINKFVYDYNGPMYHWKHKSQDLLVTPNHKIIHYNKKQTKILFSNASEIHNNNANIQAPIIGKFKRGKHLKTIQNIPFKTFVKFMGLYLSEGDLSNNSNEIRIYQKENKKDFQNVLDAMPQKWNRGKDCWRCSDKKLHKYLTQFGNIYNKYIPKRIKGMEPKYLKLFINYYGKGDGHFKNGKLQYIYSVSKQMIDDLQEISIKAGWPANIKYCPPQDPKFYDNHWIKSNGGWQINYRNCSNTISYKKNNLKIKHYKGKVYCVEVPNHIICVRRNGKYCWSGNSVPAKTRRILNYVFFTPTFKIAMSKLWYNMIHSALTTPLDANKGQMNKTIYAKGLLAAMAVNLTFDALFTGVLGFDDDQLFRRYKKKITTDEGPKELVITISNPANIGFKYYYKLIEPYLDWAIKENKPMLGAALKYSFNFELHPLWQSFFRLTQNKTRGGEQIVSQFDDRSTQLKKYGKFFIREFWSVAQIVDSVVDDENVDSKTKREAKKALKNNYNVWVNIFIDLFAYPYLRNTKDKRLNYQLQNLKRDFNYQTKEFFKQKGLINKEWEENFNKMIDEYLKEFESNE